MRSFKFTLDRKSLEVFYFSFIRPILECVDVVWDNLTQSEEDDLEKIQLESARIICGATRLVSINNLYSETGIEPLSIRRRTHRLILFYKMYHGLAPRYLTSLIPNQVGNITSYNLRNSSNLRNILCRSQLLSFLPSTINSWNSLTDEVRSAPSLNSFKSLLSRGRKDVPLFYYEGDRQTCVYHARLRTPCSNLNEHLFTKIIVESPLCTCGDIEVTFHFLLSCPLYMGSRFELYNQLFAYRPLTVPLLLFGSPLLTDASNSYIFKCVYNYLRHTRRFHS